MSTAEGIIVRLNESNILFSKSQNHSSLLVSVEETNSLVRGYTHNYSPVFIVVLAWLQAILEAPIADYHWHLATGSPRVVKLADLLVLPVLQFLQDLPRR